MGLIESGQSIARDGDVAAGQAMMREGIAMMERLKSPRVIQGWRRLGLSQRAAGDDAAALASFEQGLQICRDSGQAAEQHCVVLRGHRAAQLVRAGRADEALAEITAVRAEFDRLSPDGLFSERAHALQAEASALAALGRADEARARQDEAIALLRKAMGPGHPAIADAEAVRASLR
jgi:tetratricopeptide (TPR) repeat protein